MAADDDGISVLLNEPSESDERSVELLDEVSAVLQESIKSDEKTAELKPEEVAWVDSCLEFGPEMSDDKWISLKNALLEALSSYPTSYEATSAAMESNEDDESVQVSKVAAQDNVADDESVQVSKVAAQDNVAEHQPSEETWKEAADVEVSVSQEEVESRESIFKVWDLETPAAEEEEDELIQQLKKLLTGSREGQEELQPSNSSLALSQENVAELVTSMADLSLKPFDE